MTARSPGVILGDDVRDPNACEPDRQSIDHDSQQAVRIHPASPDGLDRKRAPFEEAFGPNDSDLERAHTLIGKILSQFAIRRHSIFLCPTARSSIRNLRSAAQNSRP
jgi:hypothetical protein